ncbi:hypothetical protein ACHAWF_013453 [Thalassiosira exigua]
MSKSSFRSILKECLHEKRRGAFASGDDGSYHHAIHGTLHTPMTQHLKKEEEACTYDILASWDEDLVHLVHTIRPFEKWEPFPGAKPLLFTGCRSERGEEVVPISMNLSFHEEGGKLKVSGDGMVDLVHFAVDGWAVRMGREEPGYRIDLAVTKADEVGG